MKLPKIPPALALFLLAPAVGELLSGSAPPLEFFSPLSFTIIVSLYGSGALIVREVKVRWRKGVGSVLLLGAAYGILEEGLMVCSFFNPSWPDLGKLAVYGRWLGVNWVWAVMLTIYHAVYSITIPIVLMELAFPERRRESWVGERMLKVVALVLVGVVAIGFVLFASLFDYWPPLPQYLLTVLAMVLSGYAAYRLPSEWGSQGKRSLPRLRLMWAIGAIGTFAFFFIFSLMPTLMPPWPVAVLFSALLVYLFGILLKSFEWKKPTEKHHFALVSGALTFFVVLAPLQELDATRTDNTTGMGLVGLAFLVMLVLLGRRVMASSEADSG